MADPPHHRDFREHAEGDTGIPRWVKVLGIIALLVALLFAAMMFIGGGGHSPRRHGGAGGDTSPASVTRDTPFGVTGGGGHTGPPEGAHG
jgi:hypothetical protein